MIARRNAFSTATPTIDLAAEFVFSKQQMKYKILKTDREREGEGWL